MFLAAEAAEGVPTAEVAAEVMTQTGITDAPCQVTTTAWR
jgi:hypothetical protein